MNILSISQDGDQTINRRTKILEILDSTGQVRVSDLSAVFNVSEVTIRNDLTHLEDKGLLIRTRGGGLKTQRVGIDQKLNEKAKINFKEKQAIGKKAAEIIRAKDIVIIDSGTTTLEVAKNITNINDLTVITNALNVASELVNYHQIRVVLLGGTLRHTSLSLIGPIAESTIKNYYCDKLFIGVDGIDSEYGISTPSIEEAHLNKLMIEISRQVVVVADSSKFKRRSFAHIAPMIKIHTVITDSGIPDDELKNLQNLGIQVIIV